MKLRKMVLNINDVDRIFMCDPENDRLSDVLRRLGLTGVKVGCGRSRRLRSIPKSARLRALARRSTRTRYRLPG